MKLAVLKGVLRALSAIPLPVLYYLAIPLGCLVRILPWRKKRIIRINLGLCFPELSPAQRERLLRKNLVEMMRLAFESGAVWNWRPSKLDRYIREIDGLDRLEAARAGGRGVILVSAHLTNWELLQLAGGNRFGMISLYTPPGDERYDAALRRNRERAGGALVPAGGDGLRRIFESLRTGGIVGILADQQPRRGQGLFAPFFGQPALTMTLVQRLARRTQAAVFFAECRRLPAGRGWTIHVEPGDPALSGSDPASACAALNRHLEAQIRRAPESYLWLYKRFDLQPEGLASPYR